MLREDRQRHRAHTVTEKSGSPSSCCPSSSQRRFGAGGPPGEALAWTTRVVELRGGTGGVMGAIALRRRRVTVSWREKDKIHVWGSVSGMGLGFKD